MIVQKRRILIVSYDLKGLPATHYGPFFQALQVQGDSWAHYLATTWLIATTNPPQQVYEALRPYVHPSDLILIAELGNSVYGSAPADLWTWINAWKG